jgi:hypothetical protein
MCFTLEKVVRHFFNRSYVNYVKKITLTAKKKKKYNVKQFAHFHREETSDISQGNQ